MNAKKTILDKWQITADYLTDVVSQNPSLRGMMLGYLAEKKLRDIFEADHRATATRKDDDHDRKKKGDLVVTYRDQEFKIEVKSLQTNSIAIQSGAEWVKKIVKEGGKYVENRKFDAVWSANRLSVKYRGHVQCDASDRRTILVGNKSVNTTCLKVGEFDILAAGIFSFREEWDFGFALNRDLPRSAYSKYPPEIRNKLLKSLVPVTWPLGPPFVSDPFILLDRIAEERR